MGIKGLKSLIDKYAKNILLTKSIEYFKNSTIAIDSSILLYKYKYINTSTHGHLLGFLNKTAFFLNNGILPVFVFDGTPPCEKIGTIDKRIEQKHKIQERVAELQIQLDHCTVINDEGEQDPNQIQDQYKISSELSKLKKQLIYVTKENRQETKTLLELIGVPVITSDGEAEMTCARLHNNNLVNFTFTEDTDSLTFGAKYVVFGAKKRTEFIIYDLDQILKQMELTYTQFIDLCILCGCDYTCTIPKIGPITSYTLIKKYETIEEIITNLSNKYIIPSSFNYVKARELFNIQTDLSAYTQLKLNKLQDDNLITFLGTKDIPEHLKHISIKKIKASIHNFGIYKNIRQRT